MKNIITILLMLFLTTFVSSQKNKPKEIYLLFDETSKKKCKISINDSILYRKYYTADVLPRTIKFRFCGAIEFETLRRKIKRPNRRNASIENLKDYEIRIDHAYSNAANLAYSNSYNPQIKVDSINNYNIITIEKYAEFHFNSKVNIIRKVSNKRAFLYHRIVSIKNLSDTINENIFKPNSRFKID